MYVPKHIKGKAHYILRTKRREQGLCPACGGKRDDEWITCSSCRAKIAGYRKIKPQPSRICVEARRRYQEQGLCRDCGRPTNNGKVRCDYHLAKQREYDFNYKVRLIMNGAI